MSTILQRPGTELNGPSGMSVAVIGPNTAHRKIVAKALSGSSARTVREISDYPAKLSDVPRMVEQHYDVVMIDVDTDQSYALALIEKIAANGRAMVVAYSKRNDPELLLSCMRAGAREFLPLPAEEDVAAEKGPEPVAQETDVAEVLPSSNRQSAPEAPIEADSPTLRIADAAPKARLQDAPPPEPAPLDFNAWDLANLHPANLAGAKVSEPRPSSDWETATKNENLRDIGRLRPAHSARLNGVEPNSRPQSSPPLFANNEPTVPELFTKSTSWLDAMDNMAPTAARARPKIDRDALGPIFRAEPEEERKPEHGTLYWVILSAGSGLLAGLLFLAYMHPFGQTVPAISANSRAHGMVQQADPPTARPRIEKPVARRPEPSAKADVSSASGGKADIPSAPQQAEQVSSEMMDAQLAAPARITSDMKKPIAVEEGPPPALSPGAMDVGGAAPDPDFSGANKVKIVPGGAAISAGVAEGLLIHKTAPIYPQFAKDNHIGGTVVLGASISKTGILQGVHVISGPDLLRNPALEALKSWRYRPYMLDNKPVAVETTIRLVFSLGAH